MKKYFIFFLIYISCCYFSVGQTKPVSTTIMGFTLHGFSPPVVLKFPREVLEILKTKSKLNVVDYVTYHPYTPNPNECYPIVKELEELVKSYNTKMNPYLCESGSFKLKNFPIWDSPVMLAEREMVKMKPVAEAQHCSGKLKVMQCWDDSPTTDIPLIALLRKYNAKATFNIIPMEKRRGFEVKKLKSGVNVLFSFLPQDKAFEGTFKVEHLTSKEMPDIYCGFKVAAHCGVPLGDSPEDSKIRMLTLQKTKEMIRDNFGQERCGFVYPGGNYSYAAMEDITKAGYLYARTTKSVEAPLTLDSPCLLPTSCHWSSPKFWEKYEDAKRKGGVFYFWGHSCELGNDPELWAWLDSIYKKISEDPLAEWVDVVDLF